jgi:hypothetical protein
LNQEIPDGWNKVKFKELAKQKSATPVNLVLKNMLD